MQEAEGNSKGTGEVHSSGGKSCSQGEHNQDTPQS